MSQDAWKTLEVTIKFRGEEMQALVAALAELPYKIGAHFIHSIQQQSAPQFAEFELNLVKNKTQQEENE